MVRPTVTTETFTVRRWLRVCVIAVALAASACGSSATTSTTTTTTTMTMTVPSIPTPEGWRTYAYGKAELSVPPTWTVVTDRGCADSSATGILALGAPKSLANCPAGVDSVVVSSLSVADAHAVPLCPAIEVNGLAVHVLPCNRDASSDIVQYLVPALDIEAVGSGAAGQPIGSSGETTVIGQVLHTLR